MGLSECFGVFRQLALFLSIVICSALFVAYLQREHDSTLIALILLEYIVDGFPIHFRMQQRGEVQCACLLNNASYVTGFKRRYNCFSCRLSVFSKGL